MSRTLVITAKHDHDVDGAKASIAARFASLKTSYIDKIGSAEMRWTGDVAHVDAKILGQKAKAEIAVGDSAIRIEVTLPWLLAGMAGTLESVLNSNADALRKPSAPQPAT